VKTAYNGTAGDRNFFPLQASSVYCRYFKSESSASRPSGLHNFSAKDRFLLGTNSFQDRFHCILEPKLTAMSTPALCYILNRQLSGISQSLQRLATAWTLHGSNPGGDDVFRTRPDRPWGSSSLLHNGYGVTPEGKAAGA
jgi:hypothetical protein